MIKNLPFYLAFLFGGIALATAPAPSLSIVRDMKTDGPVTRTLIPMAALDDLVAALVFFSVIAFVSAHLSVGGLPIPLMIFLVFLPVLLGTTFKNMMFKIALNAGHGRYTDGKRCLKSLDPKETREWILNNRICSKIESKLKNYTGYELLRLDDTTGEKDIPLKTRTDRANQFKADFYLSIHHNAGVKGGKGGGVIAITYKTVDSVTTSYQKALYDAVIKKTGLNGNRANPLQKQDLHECRESNMPCVLLECGFMDSATDVPIILTDDFADKVASACVEVLVLKGKLTKKATPSAAKKPTASKYYAKYNGASAKIDTVLKAIGVPAKHYGSWAKRKIIAKKNGIKSYLGLASQNLKMIDLAKKGLLIKV